jgi:CDP-diacylglycerol---serine O-phosphatidyltransferase
MSEMAEAASTAATKPPIHPIRYLVPNAITGASMLFGLLSLGNSASGNYALAGWMIIYAVLSDRIDGLVARALRATSQLGMQLDSFADFLNFGVAPAALAFSYLSRRPDLPYHQGGWQWWALTVVCAVWVLCAVFRLARYNITADDAAPTKIFFGVPTTLAGGLFAMVFLAMLKYEPSYATFGGPKVFGAAVTPSVAWLYLPILLALGAFTMVSSLPMPKGGKSDSKAFTMFVFGSMAFGYVCGFARTLPEICVFFPAMWVVVFLIWGQVSSEARSLKPPPWFS